MSVWTWCAIAVLGGAGALLRVAVQRALNGGWPWGTFAVNVAGAFAAGALGPGPVAAGLVGAATTFSAWMWEARELGRARGAAYLAISLALGLAAAALGRVVH